LSKPYESTFIVDAHLSTEQIESTIKKYSELIEKNGGVVVQVDRWGKRRLAYEIAKKQYGYYVYIRFDAEGSLIKVLEREYKLDDRVIRYLTVTVHSSVIAQEKEAEDREKEEKPESGSEPEKTEKTEPTQEKEVEKESEKPAEDSDPDKETEGDKKESDQEKE